ncbi:hypothetical protein [Fortiea contorta]|uniref:hypothetical protein n=1 Tax=Fortiea contorta TaxID=1892405 RepID=UPI000346C3C8|nr:hypothetical protein [Fortiea contorta]
MALLLKVLNIPEKNWAAKVTESIHVMEPDAKVDVDVENKTISVVSAASEESIKQVIVAAGYTIEGY